MPIFGPPGSAGTVALLTGQASAFAQNTDPLTWQANDSLTLVSLTGTGISVLGSTVNLEAGFDWAEYWLRAGFGLPADNSDNGVGYRAISIDTAGGALNRVPAVSVIAGTFTGYNATVCSGHALVFLNGSINSLVPCFQHTAGVAVDLVVYFELVVKLY
ncbi:MAG TPA: hypothetical protein VJ437_13175 [Acidiferrobacterales bacterium]|nr:hypothetical protein [Acidiferrobacterales bacterium]